MPASWASGRRSSRKNVASKPWRLEPVRTYTCVSPTARARATMAAASPPSVRSGSQIHMPLPTGTPAARGASWGGALRAATVGAGSVVVGAGAAVVAVDVVDGAAEATVGAPTLVTALVDVGAALAGGAGAALVGG